MQAETDRPCTRELLYRGVSADGHGRKEYLRRRARYGIAERYGQPQTEAQVMSLSLRMNPSELRPPSFGKKPIIANTFYRTRGAGGFKEATADV
ncbi:CML12 [Symbiodinium pilosum]|uniref:CML12 protein n=1 Tax=Symbiodinium pilosum TaxID=2952 RepID=A0A812UKQ8_SYMPI|nr:CML12 [Symbiodinium pilosum]